MGEPKYDIQKRPTLPVGWHSGNDIKVSEFIDRRNFVQVYKMSDGTFLYLFDDAHLRSKILDRMIDHETVVVGGRSIIFIKYRSHSQEEFTDRVHRIMVRQGLDAVAGMDELKQILTRDVIHPFLHRDTYAKYKLNIPNGILLFGPPGCGKTFIANRIAEELGFPFFEIRESNVGSPYIHATSINVAKVFKEAAEKAPSVVFIDEVSGLIPKRDGLTGNNQYREAEVNEFLVQLESAGAKGILVLAATNYPERIDSAALRSGRMDKRIFVPPPDYNARVELFRHELDDRPLALDIVPEVLGQISEGFVASDIKLAVDNAARAALEKNEVIGMDRLQVSISNTRPSLSNAEIASFVQFVSIERK